MDRESLDVAIIGGGVSGLYSAWRLASQDPSLNIGVFEATERIGGRLYTVKWPEADCSVELGAMRFPEAHIFVSSLLSNLSIPTEPFPNLNLVAMQLRGKSIPISGGAPTVPVPYTLSGVESGNPDVLLVQALERIVPNALQISMKDWFAELKTRQYGGRPLPNWGFWNLLEEVVSSEAYQLLFDAIGIESVFSNWNAAMAIPMLTQLINAFMSNKFFRPTNGWSSLPESLAAHLGSCASVSLNSPLTMVRWLPDVKMFDLSFAGAGGAKQATAKSVVLALPAQALQALDIENVFSVPESIQTKLNQVIGVEAFRLYIDYAVPWWQTYCGWSNGFSVCDLPIRQVFYGAGVAAAKADEQRVLMASYADYHSVEFWSGLTRTTLHDETQVKDPGRLDDVLDSAGRQLRNLHGINTQLPKPVSAQFMRWAGGKYGQAWHAWKPGADVSQSIPEMRHPQSGVPLYICGEAYSFLQGWVEGALCSTEQMLQQNFGLAWPTWLPATAYLGP
jgi:monoamine oxidase